MKRRTALRAIASVLALAVSSTVLAGCGRHPDGDGPLSVGGDPVEVCLPLSADLSYTFGLHILRNESQRPVEIDSVELADDVGIDIEEALVVPIEGHDLVGNAAEWPPPAAFLEAPGIDWADRSSASGTRVAPLTGNAAVPNLVLHLTSASTGGTFGDLNIGYKVAGSTFEEATTASVIVQESCG